MKTKSLLIALPVASSMLLFLSGPIGLAQEAEEKPSPEEAGAAAMAAYMESIKPGPEHKLMKGLVGNWKAKQTLWMAPGAPPMVAEATARFRMLMGGRFLVQDYESEIPGMGKFKGRGTTAFDKATKEFVNTWFDSFGTGIMVSKGKADPGDAKVVTMEGESVDPLSMKVGKFRIVTKYVSADRHEMEMYEKKDGAEERKIMQIVYTRDGEAPVGKKKRESE